MSTLPSTTSRPAAGLDPMDAFWERIMEEYRDARRAYPRVQVALDVCFDVDAALVHSKTHDLSRGGFQVRCNRDTAARIAPSSVATPAQRRARITLVMGEQRHPIVLACRMAHMSLIDDADHDNPAVAIGFSFIDVGDGECEALERFIATHLEPAPA